jgi:hypothetical protein
MAKTKKWIIDTASQQSDDSTFNTSGVNAPKSDSFLQLVYDELIGSSDFDFLEEDFVIQTVAEINTGSVSTTAGASTITASSPIFTSAMVGYVIRMNGDDHTYRIASFSTSTILIVEGVIEKTLTSVGFQMGKDRYLLPRKIRKAKTLKNRKHDQFMNQVDNIFFERWNPDPNVFSEPTKWKIWGKNDVVYTTGTVSGTSGASVITGDSTAWLTSGIEPFHKVQVGSYAYTVKSIDSATQITIFEKLATTISLSTVYQVEIDNWVIEVDPIPDEVIVIDGRGYKEVPPLVNDYDVPVLPEPLIYVLVDGLLERIRRHNFESGTIEQAEFELGKARAVGYSEDRRNIEQSWEIQSRRGHRRRY